MAAAAANLFGATTIVLLSLIYSYTVIAGAASKEAFVKKTVAAHDIVIFSKSYCPYCRRAKAVFSELKKVPYVVELDQREDGSEIQDTLSAIIGRRTVPQVFIHGKHLGGSDDTVEAYESGTLAKTLGITTATTNDDDHDL
ncbi:Glutaredoxin-C8 [Apostasia shenzhenica]|uniref:Glutaredoxin-C8 n=1 Tax=Apostasia shenzhenica TaxID=1088818 RepID=A0A2I0A5M3_9ASPA|nr:Glutaredoxin-C8 [Apostasia shenzhenica]